MLNSNMSYSTSINSSNVKSSKYKLIKQNMEYLKQQTYMNNEANKKTRLILNNLNNNSNNLSNNESLSQLKSIYANCNNFKKYSTNSNNNNKNNKTKTHEANKLSKINTDLINYVKSREKFIQHANYWHQIWLFTDNPIFEYENSIGFENPTYTYLNAKEDKLTSEISIDATVMNIYESILDLNQTTKTNSLISSSASIGINNHCELESICSPDSNDSGIHSDNHLIRHTMQMSHTNNMDDLNSEKANSINGEDSLYSSVISSKKSFTRDLSSYSKLDTADDESDDFKHVEQHELPLGWIRCCDENGIYYWHKPSGTVTRKPPLLTQSNVASVQPPEKKFNINEYISVSNSTTTTTTNNKSSLTSSSASSTTSSCSNNRLNEADYESDDLTHLKASSNNSTNSELTSSAYSSKSKLDSTTIKVEIKRFYVRSLGWVKIDENDLTPERSSKAVNKCINDLSRGIKDINDVVAHWGEGKDLYMDFDENYLVLTDPTDENVLNRQAITSIRVWGVGRDNGRDFAYVARDKQTKIHMCHVFRCDSAPAKEIANYLRDTCRRIINEKKQQELSANHLLKRPNFLPDLSNNKFSLKTKSLSYNDPNELVNLQENSKAKIDFLSPSDEPKKSIRCRYLGNTQVNRPSGMEVLNEAIEKVYMKALDDYKRLLKQQKSKNNNNNNNPNLEDEDEEINNDEYDYDNMFSFNLLDLNGEKDLGINVDVSISPSTIAIKRVNCEECLVECRVRYLSFMGISIDARLCGFIMHCADNTFRCHAFLCENSSGQLCKTIEAACKLRFAKCLDAHPDVSNANEHTDLSKTNATSATSAATARFGFLGSQLKNMFDSFRSKTLFTSSNSTSSYSPHTSSSSSSSK